MFPLRGNKKVQYKALIAKFLSAHYFKLSVACFLLLGVALFFVSENAEADTIIVDENGNGDFTKIQDAIDEASAGDKIRIWAGNYTENVDVDKRL